MKSGFIAIVGRPNVGKSTLLNAILDAKVSIVTDKAQTTRNNIKGIYNDEDTQIIFVDTPGIHKPKQKLGEEMDKMAYGAMSDVDGVLLVVDSGVNFGPGDEFVIEKIKNVECPIFVVFNKIDLTNINKITALKETYSEKIPNCKMIEIVATESFNVDFLINKIKDILPEGPAYYETDTVTDKDEIFQIKEIIREKALRILRDEVPHSMAVYMNDIDWEANPIHIQATLVVEKDSQKGIVIGAKGKRIKAIGMNARKDIEQLLHKHVFLELFVRVEQDWRNQEKHLKTFGYKVDKKN